MRSAILTKIVVAIRGLKLWRSDRINFFLP